MAISNSQTFPALLKRLIKRLQNLTERAKLGQWEQLEQIEAELLIDLDALNNSPKQSIVSMTHRGQIIEIQKLLDTATSLCSIRKEQIEPLVNALKVTQTITDSP